MFRSIRTSFNNTNPLQNHLIRTCHREPRGFRGAAIASRWEIATFRNDPGFCKGHYAIGAYEKIL